MTYFLSVATLHFGFNLYANEIHLLMISYHKLGFCKTVNLMHRSQFSCESNCLKDLYNYFPIELALNRSLNCVSDVNFSYFLNQLITIVDSALLICFLVIKLVLINQTTIFFTQNKVFFLTTKGFHCFLLYSRMFMFEMCLFNLIEHDQNSSFNYFYTQIFPSKGLCLDTLLLNFHLVVKKSITPFCYLNVVNFHLQDFDF